MRDNLVGFISNNVWDIKVFGNISWDIIKFLYIEKYKYFEYWIIKNYLVWWMFEKIIISIFFLIFVLFVNGGDGML